MTGRLWTAGAIGGLGIVQAPGGARHLSSIGSLALDLLSPITFPGTAGGGSDRRSTLNLNIPQTTVYFQAAVARGISLDLRSIGCSRCASVAHVPIANTIIVGGRGQTSMFIFIPALAVCRHLFSFLVEPAKERS